ncbi:MAG: proline iminopeptidase-family hydrolase [Candidatus Dormibacteria bacterium]
MEMTAGVAPYRGLETYYVIAGALPNGDDGPPPLLTLHGGPGATHEYLLALGDLARSGRAVVFYDQLGNGRSTHLPQRGADFWTVELFRDQLNSLIDHLGIGGRYHLLGQSWGGFLAQEHALERPAGLRSLILSDTAASFPAFVREANRLRQQLPVEVEATLRRHEEAGSTDDPEYEAACQVFYKRHLCRLDPWPEEVQSSFQWMARDPTVYHTMNGPSEFHVIGSIKNWEAESRLAGIDAPTLVVSGRHDEATPALQEVLVAGIRRSRQVIFEESSHMPFWEERRAYMAAVAGWLAEFD